MPKRSLHLNIALRRYVPHTCYKDISRLKTHLSYMRLRYMTYNTGSTPVPPLRYMRPYGGVSPIPPQATSHSTLVLNHLDHPTGGGAGPPPAYSLILEGGVAQSLCDFLPRGVDLGSTSTFRIQHFRE